MDNLDAFWHILDQIPSGIYNAHTKSPLNTERVGEAPCACFARVKTAKDGPDHDEDLSPESE